MGAGGVRSGWKFGLVEPQDVTEGSGPKVPLEQVVAAIRAEPGIDAASLAERLGVTKRTAQTYSEAAERAGEIRRERTGKRGAIRCYPADSDPDAPRNRETPRNEHAFAVVARSEPDGEAATEKRETAYIETRFSLSQSRPPAPDLPTESEDELLEQLRRADEAAS